MIAEEGFRAVDTGLVAEQERALPGARSIRQIHMRFAATISLPRRRFSEAVRLFG